MIVLPSTLWRCSKSCLMVLNQTRRTFFFLPNSQQSKVKYTESSIVNCPQALLYDIVADVDKYYQFLPNVIASTVLERRSDNLMRAKLTIGIPSVITADYISTVQLSRANRILVRSEENKFMRYLESEWHFDPVMTSRAGKEDPHRTMVKFRVEFELYSALYANMLSVVFDDFTRKTMEAFLRRAELAYQRKRIQDKTKQLTDDDTTQRR